MCGIAGSVIPGGQDARVADALTRLDHRGPDGRAVLCVGDATHGHVRLAIQDPHPRSNQPFVYRDTTVSFVGELWNWRRHRAWLQGRGYSFVTDGDTEVVAALLEYFGRGALKMMDGMFSIAWTRDGHTYVARDGLGRIPAYIYSSPFLGEAWWASERKALPADVRALAWAVPPGCSVCLTDGEGTPQRFYSAAEYRPDERLEPLESLEEEIRGAVMRRAVAADVPVCSLLSGGVDSSLVAAMLADEWPDLVTYCTTVDPDGPDVRAARIVAEHIGVELREVVVPLPTIEDVREAVRTVEVPVPSAIETTLLQAPLARRIYADGFRVAFSGEAADEVWGGYGPMARFATSDEAWRDARLRWVEKMGRADFVRTNKAMMSGSVEPRSPLADRRVVALGLGLSLKECPPGKAALRAVAERWLPAEIARRQKASWHKAQGGLREHLDELTGGARVRTYNAMVKEEFGALVRG